jgi:dCTP deaminase
MDCRTMSRRLGRWVTSNNRPSEQSDKMLSDRDIKKEIDAGKIIIDPFDEKGLLGPAVYHFSAGLVCDADEERAQNGDIIGWRIKGGQTVVILTAEKVTLSDDIGGIASQSGSLAQKKGLSLLNAGHIDPGWGRDQDGKPRPSELVVMLKNLKGEEVILRKNDKCCLVTFYKLSSRAAVPYWKSHPIQRSQDRLQNLMALSKEFQELQETKVAKKLDELSQRLEQKVSLKDLMDMFGTLLLAFSLTIALIAGIIVSVASRQSVQLGPYVISSPLIYGVGAAFVIAFLVIIVTSLSWRLSKSKGS